LAAFEGGRAAKVVMRCEKPAGKLLTTATILVLIDGFTAEYTGTLRIDDDHFCM
jgi:hypothetical protein